ncbi:hypothetical protein BRARA_K00573 [Brassica rapa]|uniref:DUF7769 domain-containing protein n=1 Tax=Brassica campestris TaxID=3711 RepID=A0A397KXK2_BRACM|nr:hypothetical protein BRARA_K00573 [Brassica rapa]
MLNISNPERWAIYNALLERSQNGELEKNTTREVSDLFMVPIRTVQRIWKQTKDTSNDEEVNVSHKKTGRCGRKKIQLELNQVMEIPLRKRTSLRSLSMGLGIATSTLHKRVKEGTIRRHTNAIKPSLTDENIRARLKFCLSMLEKDSLVHEPKFIDMYSIVHIDEKWFYMTKQTEKYYLLPEEEVPHRTCQSKNFITKVMFLAAMARPRFDDEGNETFSGKIGVFPFVTLQPAQRRSKNRDAGTLELKALTSVKRKDIKAYLIEKIIPVIHERWPIEDRGKTIFIQQDNARTHVECDDKEFQEAASKNGFDIRLMCQPPKSPDLNILDLGFFSAIQSLQYQACPTTVEDLVHAVEDSYDEYSSAKTCMKEIMKVGGKNNYQIPHMKKAALDREGRLPLQISSDVSLVQSVMDTLASSS